MSLEPEPSADQSFSHLSIQGVKMSLRNDIRAAILNFESIEFTASYIKLDYKLSTITNELYKLYELGEITKTKVKNRVFYRASDKLKITGVNSKKDISHPGLREVFPFLFTDPYNLDRSKMLVVRQAI